MPKTPRPKTPPIQEAISVRAYEIYLSETRTGDHSLEHWLRAEAELTSKRTRRKKALVNRHTEPAEPAVVACTNPIDAWCSGFEEPEKSARLRRRTMSLA